MVAAKKGSVECVKLLLYHGADINCSARVKLATVKAWNVAKKAGHLQLEQYLRKCHSKSVLRPSNLQDQFGKYLAR